MLSKNDAQMVYETLLTSPGMDDEVKLNLRVPRRNILILSRMIEIGLAAKNNEADGLFAVVPANAFEEIKNISGELLSKARLTETYNKLSALQNKGDQK